MHNEGGSTNIKIGRNWVMKSTQITEMSNHAYLEKWLVEDEAVVSLIVIFYIAYEVNICHPIVDWRRGPK